jgi:hypothetical protein
MSWQIIKKDYSYNPWRLCDERGNELQEIEKFDHPTFGPSRITASISAATKTQLIDEILSKLERQAEVIQKLRQQLSEVKK